VGVDTLGPRYPRTTRERYEQAEGHFAAAAEIEGRFGAPLFLARPHAGWARALIARGRPEDDHAQQMLEQAEETARRLGGQLVAREVAECRAALATISRSWHNRLHCRVRLDASASKDAAHAPGSDDSR
jgi:hypothetical protein